MSLVCAYWFGPDGSRERAGAKYFMTEASERSTITSRFDASQCTYKWVKEQLEEPHIGKRLVFNKDVAFAVIGKLEFPSEGVPAHVPC